MRTGLRRVAAVTGTVLVVSLAAGIAPAHAETITLTVDSVEDPGGQFAGAADGCEASVDEDCSLADAIQVSTEDHQDHSEEEDPTTFIIVFDPDFVADLDGEYPMSEGVEILDEGLVLDGGGTVTLVPMVDEDFDTDEVLGVYADDVEIRDLAIAGFGVYVTGIEVREGNVGNTITRSPVYDNTRNIYLEPADGDADAGNHGIDAPELPEATASGVKVEAPFTFGDAAEPSETDTYTLELFSCDDPNEGEEYLAGHTGVEIGQAVFFNVGAIGPSDRFSATATDEQTGDTSQFSDCSITPFDNGFLDGFDAPAVTAQCQPGAICTATPPPGTETQFTVKASGGTTSATLLAALNGGPAPECGLPTESDLILSPDWVLFGFDPPTAGETWIKDITITSLEGMTADEAATAKDETQICYAAPYEFETRAGYPALAAGEDGFFVGILPDCVAAQPGTPPDDDFGPFGPFGPYEGHGPFGPFGPFGPPGLANPGSPGTPGTVGPCVSLREVVENGGDFFTQITFRVPAGEEDPQGRSARKKKRR